MRKNGIIIKAISGFYYVKCDDTVYECKARGVFRKENISPLVGDGAVIEVTDSKNGVLDEILPRKNSLTRPAIANLDKLFIVSAYSKPEPNALLIDRLIAVCEYNNIEPIIVFNKCDMGDFTKWEDIYKKAGFKVYTISCVQDIGVSQLKAELENCICAFAGNSGVGKSSILSILLPNIEFATGDISQKLGRGRHTTRQVELFANEYGGYVADTPGFATFENDKFNTRFKEQLPHCFREFAPFINNCAFNSCSHTADKGCAVCAAVEKGIIPKSRHESYITIQKQLSQIKPWENKAERTDS